MLSIEIGENKKSGACHCCGQAGRTGHGFIFRDGSAYSVYYVAWSNLHPERGVSFAIAVGDWDDGASGNSRVCVGVEAYEGENEILFRVIEPETSPWPNTSLLGPMLDRETALRHPLMAELFWIQKGKQFAAENLVNKGNSATRFVHPQTGRSVVIDDVTKELLHVGGNGFKY